jgi:Helix-turn-helix domain
VKKSRKVDAPKRLDAQTYLTVDEVAEYLRFPNRRAAYKWAVRQGIPSCSRGRVLLYLRRDIDDNVQQTRNIQMKVRKRGRS